MTGAVKSYSPSHGYGFVTANGVDYWFHINQWREINAYPKIGQEVVFEPEKTNKGNRVTGLKVRKSKYV